MASLILGVHVSKKSKFLDKKEAADISEAIEVEMKELGLNACQIFVAAPQGFIMSKLNYDVIKNVCSDIDLSVHSTYTSVGIWKVNKNNINDVRSKKILGFLEAQLVACKKIGAHSLVLHITKQYPEDIAETMKVIKPIAKKTGVRVLLEMVASKADPLKTYETPEKLDNLASKIGVKGTWWGFCIDTAHIWAAGCKEVQKYDTMKQWFDRMAFKEKIYLIHLNGIYTECGSGKDKHAIAFSPGDKIWGSVSPKESGVSAVVEFAVNHTIPMICEINIDDATEAIKSLETIKKLGVVLN